MLNKFIFCVLLSACYSVHASIIIDNRNSGKYIYNILNEITDNKVDNAECPNLTPKLIEEIQSYQPTVNKIVSAVVNGQYSGDTWNA